MKRMTARLTVAYLQGNPVFTSDLAGLINTIHSALSTCGEQTAEPDVPVPAVAIKKSVKPNAITCLECGRELSMLKRHLATDHGTSPGEYRAKWSLPSDYPITAPGYAARRSELALKSGLGKKKVAVAATELRPVEAKTSGHRYPVSRWSTSAK